MMQATDAPDEIKRADWSGLEETGRITGVSFSREAQRVRLNTFAFEWLGLN